MPLTEQELKQLLDENHQALAVYTTGKHSTEAIVVVIDNNHPDHGLPMSVRFANSFRAQTPRDSKEED